MEDYEKRYKEALSRAATELENCGADKSLRNMIYAIFPDELKESEDEKIKKALIRFHKSTIDIDGIKGDDIIAWLEKQGEQPSAIRWYDVSLIPQEMEELLVEWDSEDATWHEIAFYHADTKTFWNGTRQVENVTRWCYIIDLLEKQGKQKPFDYEHATITQKDFAPINDTDDEIAEAIKNTNVLDMVEPKFKVGDWITDGEAVFHITSYDIDYGYQLETQKGTSFHFSDEKVESKYHLWTIQDAKDGDVLISQYGNPFIYNGNYNSLNIGAYCGITCDDNKFKIAEEKCHWTENVDIKPATKEQRDTLMKAMTDAGYEWNAEKKELKKIEQKSAAWSDEDEKMYKIALSCIETLEDITNGKNMHADVKDWLKSLKNRIGG